MNEEVPDLQNYEAKNRINRPVKTISAELVNVFNFEEIKDEVRRCRQLIDFLQGRQADSSKTSYFNKICGLCLAQTKEPKLINKFRKKGAKRLNMYLVNSTRKEVQSCDLKLLTWSCLSVVSFFFQKKQRSMDDCSCFHLKNFDKTKSLFRSAMYQILPEKQSQIIKYTIKYFTLTDQWNSEEFDAFVFQELLTMITKPEILVAKVIKQVEVSQRERNIVEAHNVSYTLTIILENAYWDKYLFNHLLHNCFNTLLKLYLLANTTTPSILKVDNIKLRECIKTCIKNFVSNIKDNKGLVSVMDSISKCLQDNTIEYEDRAEITDIILYCAQLYHPKHYRESITPDMLDLLLKNITGFDRYLAMSSHKIFHYLLDRHNNNKHFIEPIHYFRGRTDFFVNYEYISEDTNFFKTFSKKFFDGIGNCFLVFHERIDLITCYTTVCYLLMEMPDPVVTINAIHVIITTQNSILHNEVQMSLTTKAQMHAIIASILALICHIHEEEASALKRYVDEVIRFRTENSPHLLPPLQNKYSVASHYTTAYHDQLYFQEDEILYALQRCWLAKRITSG